MKIVVGETNFNVEMEVTESTATEKNIDNDP